jgi:flagellar biosynthesis/type III secretory pathway chaperone
VAEGMAVDTQTVDALLLVLNQEFDALKVQDLAQFEALQAGKAALLARLEGVSPDAITEDVRDILIQCRDAHRRNETLIQHQLVDMTLMKMWMKMLLDEQQFKDTKVKSMLQKGHTQNLNLF